MARRLALLLALALTVLGGDALHRSALQRRARFPADEALLLLPPPAHLRWMSLGYREALADLIWVRALIFAGAHLKDAQVEWTDRYADAIVTLDPHFERAYRWGGLSALYVGGRRLDRDMVERARSIYARGLEQFPESHELLFRMGMLLLHELPSARGVTPEEIAAARREGAAYIRRAAAFGADPLIQQYAATLITEDASDELAIQFLETRLAEAEDEDLRRMLRAKLRALTGGRGPEHIEALRARFKADRARAGFAYLPDTLWALLRPAPGPFAAETPRPPPGVTR